MLGLISCSPGEEVQTETPQAQSIEILDRPFSADKDEWPHSISDIAPDPRAHFGRLENGLRYVILPVPDDKDIISIQLNVFAGFNDEPEGQYGVAHLLEHMAFRGARSNKDRSIIHDLQSAGVEFGRDLNGFTRAEDTFYYVNLPSEDQKDIDTALRNISQFVMTPHLSAENMEAEKKIVLAELKARKTISRRAKQDFRQFQFPDQPREKIDGAGTQESLNAITLSDVEVFFDTHYNPENVLLVVTGDVQPPRVKKTIKRLFLDWDTKTSEPRPDRSVAEINLADFPATAAFEEKRAKTQINVIENLDSTLTSDVFQARKKQFLEGIGLSILKRRLNKIITDDKRVSWITPFKSRYRQYDIRGIRSSAKDYVQMMTYFEQERLRIIKYGFTEEEIDFAIRSERAALEKLAERPEQINAWTEAWRISNDYAAGRVYSSRQQDLENFESFYAAASAEDFEMTAKNMWTDFEPRYWTKSARSLTEILEEVMAVPAVVSKLELEEPDGLSQSEFRFKTFSKSGVVSSRDKISASKIERVLYENGVRLNYQRRTQESGDIQIVATIEGDLPKIMGRYAFISEQLSAFSRADIKGASKEDINIALVGKEIGFGVSFGRGRIELTSSTRPEDLETALSLLATFIAEVDFESKYLEEAVKSYKTEIDKASRSSPLQAGSLKLHSVYSDNAPPFKSRRSGFYPIESRVEKDIKSIFDQGAIEVGVVGDFDPNALETAFAKSLGAMPARDPIEQAPVYQSEKVKHIDPGLSTITYRGTDEQMALLYCWPRPEIKTPEDEVYRQLTEELMRNKIYASLRGKSGLIYSPSNIRQTNPVFPNFQFSCFGVQIEPDVERQAHDSLTDLIEDIKTDLIGKEELNRALEPMKTRYRKNGDSNRWAVWKVATAYSQPDKINEYREQERYLERIKLKEVNETMVSFFDRADLHIFRVQNFQNGSKFHLNELRLKSYLGDEEAEHRLGRKLLRDASAEKRKEGLDILDKAAARGHEDAIRAMADYYRGRERDLKKTAYYLELSTDSAKSAHELAELYVRNYKTFPDVPDEKIMALYWRSAEGGWGRGQYGLAERLKDGTFTQRDEIGAMKWALISNQTRRGSLEITDEKEIARFVTGLTQEQQDEATAQAEKWIKENAQ